MDVHDTSGANLSREDGKQRPLEPGMVLTIEPGLYIDPAVAQEYQVDPKWWGLGIRIEDNVLVTPTGRENLTRKAPKTVEAIERLMQKG
jgi:Xaa-Pro aminopeptidase